MFYENLAVAEMSCSIFISSMETIW